MGRQLGRRNLQQEEPLLHDLLDRMESDLRLLEGTVSVLRGLSETSDAIEPVALEAIAHLAGEAVERVTARWREACGVLRGG